MQFSHGICVETIIVSELIIIRISKTQFVGRIHTDFGTENFSSISV